MSKVILRRTSKATTYGDTYMPANYDVMVDGRKVGQVVGRHLGRNKSGKGYWHEMRDLKGNTVENYVEVRGAQRKRIDDAALKLAENLPD